MEPVPAISVVADHAPPSNAPRDVTPDGLEALVEAFAAHSPAATSALWQRVRAGAPTSAPR